MAGRKNASKTSKKVQVDFTFATQDKINEAKRLETKKSKKARKKLRKLGFGVIMLSLVLLIGSAVGSYFGMKHLVRNDVFELNGKDEITLQIGENYTDERAKVIAFGKNDESKVKVETNLTKNEDGTYSATEEGTYYMIYTVDNLKYGKIFKVQKIRLITFVEATEQDEIESLNPGGNA